MSNMWRQVTPTHFLLYCDVKQHPQTLWLTHMTHHFLELWVTALSHPPTHFLPMTSNNTHRHSDSLIWRIISLNYESLHLVIRPHTSCLTMTSNNAHTHSDSPIWWIIIPRLQITKIKCQNIPKRSARLKINALRVSILKNESYDHNTSPPLKFNVFESLAQG